MRPCVNRGVDRKRPWIWGFRTPGRHKSKEGVRQIDRGGGGHYGQGIDDNQGAQEEEQSDLQGCRWASERCRRWRWGIATAGTILGGRQAARDRRVAQQG